MVVRVIAGITEGLIDVEWVIPASMVDPNLSEILAGLAAGLIALFASCASFDVLDDLRDL